MDMKGGREGRHKEDEDADSSMCEKTLNEGETKKEGKV